MIRKIELRIFWIIFVLLSILIGTIMTINTYHSYQLAVKGIASYAERIFDDRRILGYEPEGFYAVRIANNTIEDETMYSSEMKKIVQNIIDNKRDYGIMGNYIYQYRVKPEKERMRRNGAIIRKQRCNIRNKTKHFLGIDYFWREYCYCIYRC